MSDEDPTGEAGSASEAFVCDFCGRSVARVQRVALDRDYDRLQTPHRVQYACETCSAAKERQRLAAERG